LSVGRVNSSVRDCAWSCHREVENMSQTCSTCLSCMTCPWPLLDLTSTWHVLTVCRSLCVYKQKLTSAYWRNKMTTIIGDDNEFIVAATCTSLYLSQQLVLCCVSITMFNRRKKKTIMLNSTSKGDSPLEHTIPGRRGRQRTCPRPVQVSHHSVLDFGLKQFLSASHWSSRSEQYLATPLSNSSNFYQHLRIPLGELGPVGIS